MKEVTRNGITWLEFPRFQSSHSHTVKTDRSRRPDNDKPKIGIELEPPSHDNSKLPQARTRSGFSIVDTGYIELEQGLAKLAFCLPQPARNTAPLKVLQSRGC